MVLAAFGLLTGAALAQSGGDVGLVNGVSGAPTYLSEGAPAGKVQPYMRVRQGDRFTVPPGATVRLVYFQGSRQETWKGPASFRAGTAQGESANGAAPEVAVLPAVTPQKMARVPELIQIARLGGVTVRGGVAASPKMLDATQQEELAQARQAYGKLRAQAAADDITPELYLMAVLQEYSLYDDMKGLVDEMRRRQPASQEVTDLANWVQTRLQAPR